MSVVVVTPPAVEPVSLAEARTWCRISSFDTSQDTLIAGLIKAARERAETITGRAFVKRTLALRSDGFYDCAWRRPPWGGIELPFPPLIDVASVKYRDTDDVEQTVDPTTYEIDAHSEPGVVWLLRGKYWPTAPYRRNGVVVTYTAGYLTATDSPPNLTAEIPEAVREWMQVRIVTRYDQRGAVKDARQDMLPHDFIDGMLDGLIVGTRFA